MAMPVPQGTTSQARQIPVSVPIDVRAVPPSRDGDPLLSGPAESPPDEGHGSSSFIAAVCATDGILFAAAAESYEACLGRIAEYVRCRVDTQLWPMHATRVRGLLDDGHTGVAVSLYFECVGQRWDEEWLVTMHLGGGDDSPLGEPRHSIPLARG
jgi:hypothetical protein